MTAFGYMVELLLALPEMVRSVVENHSGAESADHIDHMLAELAV